MGFIGGSRDSKTQEMVRVACERSRAGQRCQIQFLQGRVNLEPGTGNVETVGLHSYYVHQVERRARHERDEPESAE